MPSTWKDTVLVSLEGASVEAALWLVEPDSGREQLELHAVNKPKDPSKTIIRSFIVSSLRSGWVQIVKTPSQHTMLETGRTNGTRFAP